MRKIVTNILITLLLIMLAIAATLAVVFIFQYQEQGKKVTTLEAQVKTLETEKAALAEQLENSGEIPEAKECYHTSADGWITINHPCTDDTLGRSFRINGVAFGLFENTLSYSLEDANGEEIISGSYTVPAPDLGLPGVFDTTLNWSGTAETETGTLILFGESAEDGSRQHVVEIEVKF